MTKQKLILTEDKWLLAIHALIDFRNKRIAEVKCLDAVNDTLLAVMNAKTKKMRIAG